MQNFLSKNMPNAAVVLTSEYMVDSIQIIVVSTVNFLFSVFIFTYVVVVSIE